MKRHVLAIGALLLLVSLAGCSSILGPGEFDEDDLVGNSTYDWNSDVNATIDIGPSNFTAVYRVENRSTFDAYEEDGLGQEHALEVSTVRFRSQDGQELTVRNDSLSVERSGGRTTITLPDNATGQLAFTAPRFGKTFTLPTFVTGSYNVTMPESARIGIPLLGQVHPGGFSTSIEPDGRMTVSWQDVDTSHFRISWYLQRDVLLFGGLFVIGIVLAIGGSIYYYRQIKQLEARRNEVGLDVELDDDDDPRDRGPPPGMR